METEERRLYRNNTGGWLGVVQLGPTNQPEGKSVEPGGTVWLTPTECRLTAHAPRDPADNPFVTQTYSVTDPTTGQRTDVKVTPLTAADEAERPSGSGDRFVPTESAEPPDAPQRRTESPPPSPGPQPLAPETAKRPSATPLAPPVPPGVQAALAASQGDAPAVEETAAVATPEGEETGAAVKPEGSPPEGEFGVHEEVGTPDAPAEGA